MNTIDISKILSNFSTVKYNYTIWIVANVNDTVQDEETFIKHTNFSEFFSKVEFASISSAIIELFGYVRTFYSETEFMQYVLCNIENLQKDNIIVFNFTRDGICEGKKSLIPAFCDLYGLKHTSSNAFVTSLLRNKLVYTKYLGCLGISVPLTTCSRTIDKNDIINFKGKSVIVKNIYESASIGITENNIIKFADYDTLVDRLNGFYNSMNTENLLIQEYISGAECEVFVIREGNTFFAFEPVMLKIVNSDIITSKISDDYDYTFLPLFQNFSPDLCDRIKKTAKKSAQCLNVKNYARFDFRINSNNNFYLIDIAGSPYLTRHSSIEYLFTRLLSLKYSDIFLLIAAITAENYSQDVYCKSDNGSPLEV